MMWLHINFIVKSEGLLKVRGSHVHDDVMHCIMHVSRR